MKIAIVTGASSGIGREFVKQIAEQEKLDEIWVIARREDRLNELKDEFKKVRPIVLDLIKDGSRDIIKSMLADEKPDIRILVNAAGFGKFGPFIELTEQEIDSIILLNLKSLIDMTYDCIPYMSKGARILNMGSASCFQPLPEFNMYATTKTAVLSFSRALNVELKSKGITITSVCPGWVRTEFYQVAKDTKNPDALTNFKPLYEPEDVIRKALKDSRKGKDLSILGMTVKLQRLSTRLFPIRFVMKIWMKIK